MLTQREQSLPEVQGRIEPATLHPLRTARLTYYRLSYSGPGLCETNVAVLRATPQIDNTLSSPALISAVYSSDIHTFLFHELCIIHTSGEM